MFFLCWVIICIPELKLKNCNSNSTLLLELSLKCLWSVKILFIQANPLNMFFYLTGEGERRICTNLMGSQLWSTLFSTFFCQNEQNLSKADTSKKVSARFREVPLYMKIYYLLFVLKSMMKWKFRRWFLYIFYHFIASIFNHREIEMQFWL